MGSFIILNHQSCHNYKRQSFRQAKNIENKISLPSFLACRRKGNRGGQAQEQEIPRGREWGRVCVGGRWCTPGVGQQAAFRNHTQELKQNIVNPHYDLTCGRPSRDGAPAKLWTDTHGNTQETPPAIVLFHRWSIAALVELSSLALRMWEPQWQKVLELVAG